MKKISIIALVVVLALSLAACGRSKDKDSNKDTSKPTQESILPDTMPTGGTNIPDPEVNPNSTNGMDGTTGTDGTDGTNMLPGGTMDGAISGES